MGFLIQNRLHGGLELARVDLAGGFSVEQVEGFPELLDLILSESGTLDLLFGGTFGWHVLSHYKILIKIKL